MTEAADALRKMVNDSNHQRTHSLDCWRWHWQCAALRVLDEMEALEAQPRLVPIIDCKKEQWCDLRDGHDGECMDFIINSGGIADER